MAKQKQEQEAPRMLDGLKVEAQDWRNRIAGFGTELAKAEAQVGVLATTRSQLLLPANTGDAEAAEKLRHMHGQTIETRMRVDDLGDCIEQAGKSLARIEREIFEAEHVERLLRRSKHVAAGLEAAQKMQDAIVSARQYAEQLADCMGHAHAECGGSEAERLDLENAGDGHKFVIADAANWLAKGLVPPPMMDRMIGGADAEKIHDKLHGRVSGMLVNADEARERARNIEPQQHRAEAAAALEAEDGLIDVSAG